MVHLKAAIAEFDQKMRLKCEDFDNAFVQAKQKLVLQFRSPFFGVDSSSSELLSTSLSSSSSSHSKSVVKDTHLSPPVLMGDKSL